jgi:hypothetical protein
MRALTEPQASAQPPPENDWWGSRLSLAAIRNHTRTDDTPGVSDAQLELYRSTAAEGASMYTGYLWTKRNISEPVAVPYDKLRFGKDSFVHRLKHPPNGETVYLLWRQASAADPGAPGSRKISLPFAYIAQPHDQLNPFPNRTRASLTANYVSGFACADELPHSA